MCTICLWLSSNFTYHGNSFHQNRKRKKHIVLLGQNRVSSSVSTGVGPPKAVGVQVWQSLNLCHLSKIGLYTSCHGWSADFTIQKSLKIVFQIVKLQAWWTSINCMKVDTVYLIHHLEIACLVLHYFERQNKRLIAKAPLKQIWIIFKMHTGPLLSLRKTK